MTSTAPIPTAEYDEVCEHEWQELTEEQKEKYGTIIAKCLSRWRECRKCDKVKFVGGKLPLSDSKPWD